MQHQIKINTISNDHQKQIVDLILPIQQLEFNVPITLEDQPDLLDIEQYYRNSGGNFWGAELNGELVGTIALISTGHGAGAIRKMFVKKEYRGKEAGVAQGLFNVLISYSRDVGMTDLYLGTVDTLQAAQRFYEKNGFIRIPSADLPDYFPRMQPDNVFYHLSLNDNTEL